MVTNLTRIAFFLILIIPINCSKFSGQRIFNDYHMIDFIDPAKHGFHIILDQRFVDTHLQATKLPTVFASAIPLKKSTSRNERGQENRTDVRPSKSPAAIHRVTKVLYPENGGPEDGLLDGRTIKLLGLQERSWYYICLEFESNLNRHEMATGLSCDLRRTLDKFGKTADSTVNDVEVLEITDRSMSIQLSLEVDFPLRLTVFLDQTSTSVPPKSVPVQIFIVHRRQTLNVVFGPFLDADSSYGRLCILEEPLTTDLYTAMGREAKATLENCYFDDLRTKPAAAFLQQKEYQENSQLAEEPNRFFGQRLSGGPRCDTSVLIVFLSVIFVNL